MPDGYLEYATNYKEIFHIEKFLMFKNPVASVLFQRLTIG